MSDVDSSNPSQMGFWGINQYKTTVKRAENGSKLCNELMNFTQERADIEKAYAQSLKKWAQKWENRLREIGEYGTSRNVWLSFCDEATQRAQFHSTLRQQLQEKVQATIRDWQKDNYHKQSLAMVPKEVKLLDNDFQRAQKPWAKKMKKMEENKKEFFHANRQLSSNKNMLANAKNDTSMSAEQVRKLEDKLSKCEDELKTSRKGYELSVKELDSYRSRYKNDMTEIFEKSQEFEEKRMEFFQNMYHNLSNILDISGHTELKDMYELLHESVARQDIKADLNWWSETSGVDSPASWPAFEEYSQDFRSISKSKSNVLPDQGVVLTSLNHSPVAAEKSYSSNDSIRSRDPVPVSSTPSAPNVEYVRALYDYVGEESDEISFKAGEIIEKLSDIDSQGWCTGKINGRTGLYPDSYVELVTSGVDRRL